MTKAWSKTIDLSYPDKKAHEKFQLKSVRMHKGYIFFMDRSRCMVIVKKYIVAPKGKFAGKAMIFPPYTNLK